MRARTLAIRAFAKVFEQVDVIVTPTTGVSNQVTVTNLTGHPAVIVPNGCAGRMRRRLLRNLRPLDRRRPATRVVDRTQWSA